MVSRATPNRTAQQVYNGLAGMWLVEDEVSKSPPSPTIMVWMIFRSLSRINGWITPVRQIHRTGKRRLCCDTLLVNGVQSPYVGLAWLGALATAERVEPRRYQRQMNDGRPLHVISGDSGIPACS
ncbi:hypothetical protein ACNKHV_19070 [Shigella flexneri]